ncbi:MAG: HDOD domain-containing protein [Thermodesulfobacteria bacterium]|nr:HDOD domain-containing protein [Thermodesulfobacteriota bacterium]
MGFIGVLKKRIRPKDPRKELKKLLADFELPHFPKVAMYILEGLRDPNVPVPEIARRVALDPAIHLKVLKTVNSAAFGLPKQVTNIEHAVALLGRARLESLILPLAVRETLPNFRAACLNQELFWLAGARRAILARQLAHLLNPQHHVEAFSAGLLQDMAIPVIMHLKEKVYCPTLETWNVEKEVRLDELERRELGFDHQAIGRLMAEEWNLPDYLVQAVSAHHSFAEDLDPAIYLVSHLRYQEDPSESPEAEIIVEEAHSRFNLNKDIVRSMLKKTYAEAEELARIFL